jgi:hypothetical protein
MSTFDDSCRAVISRSPVGGLAVGGRYGRPRRGGPPLHLPRPPRAAMGYPAQDVGRHSGIRPVVAAALGFTIQGMAVVAKSRQQQAPCIRNGIRGPLEDRDSGGGAGKRRINTASAGDPADARAMTAEDAESLSALRVPPPPGPRGDRSRVLSTSGRPNPSWP